MKVFKIFLQSSNFSFSFLSKLTDGLSIVRGKKMAFVCTPRSHTQLTLMTGYKYERPLPSMICRNCDDLRPCSSIKTLSSNSFLSLCLCLKALPNRTFIIKVNKDYEGVVFFSFLKGCLNDRMKDQCPNFHGRKGNDTFFPLLF